MVFLKYIFSLITALLVSLSLMPGPVIITDEPPVDPVVEDTEIRHTAAVTDVISSPDLLDNISTDSFGSNRHDKVTGASSRNGIVYFCGSAGNSHGDFSGAGNCAKPFGFIRRYDSAGNLTAEVFVTDPSRTVYLSDICVLRNGNAVVSGYTTPSGAQSGVAVSFLAEYSADLVQLWKTEIQCSDSVSINSVSATSNGFVAGGRTSGVDGDFKGTDFFGAPGAFLSRYTVTEDPDTGVRSPSLMWQKTFFGEGTSEVSDVSVDTSNNIFVCITTNAVKGNYSAFEGLIPGSLDNVLLRYSGNGVIQWSLVMASSGRDYFNCVAPDGTGGCLAGGYCVNEGASAGSPLGGTLSEATHRGGADSFAFKVNSSGQIVWHRSISGSGDDYLLSIAKFGSYYALGGYSGSRNYEFSTNRGEYDGFIDVINASGARSEMLNFGGTENDRINALTASGGYLFAGGMSVSRDGFFSGMNQYAYLDYSTDIPMDSGDCFTVIYN